MTNYYKPKMKTKHHKDQGYNYKIKMMKSESSKKILRNNKDNLIIVINKVLVINHKYKSCKKKLMVLRVKEITY